MSDQNHGDPVPDLREPEASPKPAGMPKRNSSETAAKSLDPEGERALADLRDRIGARIRPLLDRLPEEQLASLIDRMARIQLAYQGKASKRSD
jgi:hypothetical protein